MKAKTRSVDASPAPWLGWGLFAASIALLMATLSDYGIASDVGNYFESSLKQLEWWRSLFAGIRGGDPGAALGVETVHEVWRWNPERIPHPPLSRELGAVTYALGADSLGPLTAYRVAVVIAWSALIAGCGAATARFTGSTVAGIGAGLSALVFPAMFAYGHLALTDPFLAAFWFWATVSIEMHVRSGRVRWLVAAGVLLGAAVATKFTGLLLIPVLTVWLMVRGRYSLPRVLILSVVALAVFTAANPLIWVDPTTGFSDFLAAGFGRAENAGTQITTEYFGAVFEYRPPWHYPFVWTAIVTPISLLIAAVIGLSAWKKTTLTALCVLNIVVMYGVLMLPSAPMHDGIRLFLPAMPFICCLAGLGMWRLSTRLGEMATMVSDTVTSDFVSALVLIGFLVPAAIRTAEYHPYQLSYFNALIGGIVGAEERGLEVTGLKEALTPDVLAELAGEVGEGDVVAAGFLTEEVCFYQGVGDAPESWIVATGLETLDGEPGNLKCAADLRFGALIEIGQTVPSPDYVMVLNRKGQFTTLEWALAGFGGESFYELTVKGVPILRVYRVE